MKQANAFDDAAAYKGYIGRWSKLIAEPFLSWLNIPSGKSWLDVGSGTGILTQAILDHAAPQKVVGIDLAEGFVALARQDVTDTRAEFRVGDASNLNITSAEFDVAVSGLVINFVPSPANMVSGMKQAVKSGGTVALYLWDYAGHMEIMRHFWQAAIAIDPPAAAMDSAKQFAIADLDALRTLFEATGLKFIEVMPIDAHTHFRDFDDYWLPFLGAQGSVSKYLSSLSNEGREALRAQLQKQLPINADGSIDLIARALAVKGIT
jgi:SAM-dependent methyltransferase